MGIAISGALRLQYSTVRTRLRLTLVTKHLQQEIILVVAGWINLKFKFLVPILIQDFRRLLICGGNSFFYTDNDGISIQESEGLDALDDWGNTIRSIVKDDIIYLLTNEWDYVNWNAACAIYKSIDNTLL